MEERVKYLFAKYLDNTCTKEEFDEVFFYLQMEENEPYIRELLRRELRGMVAPATAAKPVRRLRHRKTAVLAFALVCILLSVVVIVRNRMPRPESPGLAGTTGILLKQATRPSEYKYLLLPDSTQVWLNAGSTLEVPASFGRTDRKVVLSGEAFFDVTHSERLPFIIYTGRVSTEVLGTAFNIKAYPDLERIVVAVKKGKVKVNFANAPVAMLTMGQQVSIGNKDYQVKEKRVKAEDADSWQQGRLVYDDYTIQDIVSDLERVYGVKIGYDRPAVGAMRVSTAFKRGDGVVKALEVLSELTDTKFSVQ